MYRNIIEQLKEWKNKEGRKPLSYQVHARLAKPIFLKDSENKNLLM